MDPSARTGPAPAPTPDPSGERSAPVAPFPRRLTVVLVTQGPPPLTLRERITSWFDPDTDVRMSVAPATDRQQMLTVPVAQEAALWVVQLSPDQALVTFSVAHAAEGSRHLVREVHLEHGLDDLGLERLAYVIHSGVVALGEGAVGTERAIAERHLDRAGVPPSPAPPAEPPPWTTPPEGPPDLVPKPPTVLLPAERYDLGPALDPPVDRGRVALTLAGGYHARFRGPEGIGQGPHVELGVLQTGTANAVFAALVGQLALPGAFESNELEVELQTGNLRLNVGLERRLTAQWIGALAAGAGGEIARIRPLGRAGGDDEDTTFIPRSAGTQVRPAVGMTAGISYRSSVLDLGLFPGVTFLVSDVHYAVATGTEQRRVLSAQRVQPGVSLRLRFRRGK